MKVLIVDDHAVVRFGLHRLFQTSPDIVLVEAADAAQALAAFASERPDVVIIDINLPGIDGFDLLRRLLAADPKLRALVFSMHAEPIYATQALKAGALGYVSKTAPPHEIVAATRRVAAGAVYIEQQIAQEMALSGMAVGAAAAPITARERELLRLLGEGRSLAEMATATGVSYKTVANTLSLLKARLGASTTADLIRIAIKGGYAP